MSIKTSLNGLEKGCYFHEMYSGRVGEYMCWKNELVAKKCDNADFSQYVPTPPTEPPKV